MSCGVTWEGVIEEEEEEEEEVTVVIARASRRLPMNMPLATDPYPSPV